MNNFKLAGPFSDVVLSKPLIMVVVMSVLVLCQALGVIYAKHSKRITHSKLQTLYAQRDKLQVEWSQLLLELSTWQSEARIERIARNKLDMVVPDKVNLIVP